METSVKGFVHSKEHPLKELVRQQKAGMAMGIFSICSANRYVLEAAMEHALLHDAYVLIEATANQVNQFGGYTGMQPADFRDFVYFIAEKLSFSREKIILGGDHLGPLTWKNEPEESAMEKACVLVREYVLAGFTKIHLDTSMHLGDDNRGTPLDTRLIAERGTKLCRAAEEAFLQVKTRDPMAMAPVYVVGSEVPIPGGSQEEEGIQVTKVPDFERTVETFRSAFLAAGLAAAWENVVAVVVQPGVEFGDETIHEYDRAAARELCQALKNHPNLVFEGHSTDYQTPEALRRMVEDGIAILKVGPALTFALREALFSLNFMEIELFRNDPEVPLSNFIGVLEAAMVKNPDYWKSHYRGDTARVRFALKYSPSDRARYYLPLEEVQESMDQLVGNLRKETIPLALIDQFMPSQYRRIRRGVLRNDPEALLKDRVVEVLEDYAYAAWT